MPRTGLNKDTGGSGETTNPAKLLYGGLLWYGKAPLGATTALDFQLFWGSLFLLFMRAKQGVGDTYFFDNPLQHFRPRNTHLSSSNVFPFLAALSIALSIVYIFSRAAFEAAIKALPGKFGRRRHTPSDILPLLREGLLVFSAILLANCMSPPLRSCCGLLMWWFKGEPSFPPKFDPSTSLFLASDQVRRGCCSSVEWSAVILLLIDVVW